MLGKRDFQRMKTLLLHNPTAGDSGTAAEKLMAALHDAGFSPLYCSAKSKERDRLLGKKWDLIFVAGGDGTVAKIARALKDRKKPIAILPTGTANNIARSLGIVGEVEQLLPRLSLAHTRPLDLAVASGPWGKQIFLEAVGLGAIAKAISQKSPRPPKPLRLNAGREELQEFVREAEAERLEIDIDGDTFAGEFLMVEILNLNFTGPGLQLAYSALPDDQMLDVVFLFESDRAKMLEWLDHHPDETPPPVAVRRGRKARLTWYGGYLRIDSDIYLPPEKPSKVRVGLRKHRLNILVPASEDEAGSS